MGAVERGRMAIDQKARHSSVLERDHTRPASQAARVELPFCQCVPVVPVRARGDRLRLWRLPTARVSRLQPVASPRHRRSMTRTIACFALFFAAAATPQTVVDELLAADRAFSAASAKTDLVSGLSAMFADDVVIPMPPGQFVNGKAAVIEALRANADNLTSKTEWT